MRLRLVGNCMPLPVLYFIPFLTKQRLLIEISTPVPFPSPASTWCCESLYTVFFFLSHYLPDTFISSTDSCPSPFLSSDITVCRSENKKTSRASGTKVHIHIINLRFVKKTIETRKKINLPFLCFFLCMSPAA